jgi:predicted TIM-barrel fold metal-dependent hydrolase
MDAAGVDQAVLLLPDFTFVLKDHDIDIAEMIRQHAAILERHPGRFRYMCGVDPGWGPEGIDIFERAVRDQNCSGLKIYPPCGYSPSDRALYPYYEICRRYGVPVLLHTGPTAPLLTFAYSDPGLIDDAARAFPEVDFILAHGGVNNVEAACLLAAYRPNVFIDLGGYPASIDSNGVAGGLRQLFNRRLNHKIIFGTDWPIFKLRGAYKDIVATAMGGVSDELDDREAALVLAGTMDNLLKAHI